MNLDLRVIKLRQFLFKIVEVIFLEILTLAVYDVEVEEELRKFCLNIVAFLRHPVD
ncbi:hypothetical protein SAMN04489747_3192 [Auraticoccus monumenti]|uniref:Uncharacterized protein n=1 Tax=Auraticoccus monumenti TaxID=675864 RepID=A0A1G7C7Z4_9ACTN|nr:hypothetical protein SAMN04489747_3192 [Auraticoccus monumenti]